jgi:hypothetical protein
MGDPEMPFPSGHVHMRIVVARKCGIGAGLIERREGYRSAMETRQRGLYR